MMQTVTGSEALAMKAVADPGYSELAQLIEEFVRSTEGRIFEVPELDRELDIRTAKGKANRRQILRRFRQTGLIEYHGNHSKYLRLVDTKVRAIDFKAAGKQTPLEVKYPFGIEKLFNTYPGNLIVVAGSSDSGKSAFMLNFVRLNMESFPIFYQTSEMGDAELASRLENFEDIALQDWKLVAEERSMNFADGIRPDAINITDYLELESGKFYEVVDHLRAIHDRLNSGIALVALQMAPGARMGRGGAFSLEKPRLYLLMDNGVLTIRKAKNWANPKEDPNWLRKNYKLTHGCRFIETSDWYKGGN